MQIKKVITGLLFILFFTGSHAQSVGLVLSGGGAKGLSHIGVIRALEENNIPIDYIAGTSMGAIIGALYSIGITPNEMAAMFRSQEFNSWYKGEAERGYATYIYRRQPSAEMVTIPVIRGTNNRLSIKLPTSLVAPYPMDLAVMQIFASSSAAAGNNFDNLMIPYRCVAADIANKRPLTLRSGDLGSAVRASMTYPFLFKPIIIDSVLLFDGGFYNNFPWDIMVSDFNPDFIIGSKCSGNAAHPDADDILSQIENMLMVETDYTIPQELGVLIDINLEKVAIMDFHRIDEIIEIGYNTAITYINGIKSKVNRRVTQNDILNKRLCFRTQTLPLRFADVIIESRHLDTEEKEFIARTVSNNSDDIFNFEQLKKGFYRVVATDNINTIYPVAHFRSDSLFDLHLRVTKKEPLRLSIGGNISSSSLNQGYLGVQYNRFTANPWRANADFNLGRYYSGLSLSIRQDIGINPLWFYEAQFNIHRFDYFGSSQTTFFANRTPSNIQESEMFVRISAGTPLKIDKNVLAKGTVYAGENLYEYFQTQNFTSYDKPDRTLYSYISPTLSIERNTSDYRQYPTSGKIQRFSLRYTYLSEKYTPGSTSLSRTEKERETHNTLSARLFAEQYYTISGFLSLGIGADITLSNRTYMGDYISTLMYLPAYHPNPHSKTILTRNLRAPSFAGLSITPIIRLSRSFSFHLQCSYFQPYRLLTEDAEGDATFTETFPKGTFSAHLAAVLQTVIGPISFSASYYDKPDVKWYPQLNIGFLIFKPKALEN